MHQPLSGVPNKVADGLLGVNTQQVLQDAEEGDLLGSVGHLLEDRIKDVQMGVDIDPMGSLDLGLVALSLLIEHVKLHLKNIFFLTNHVMIDAESL